MGAGKEDIKEEVAKNLQYFRRRAGLTQKALAEKLGVRNNTISQWENCVNSVDVDSLFKACCILGISVNDIYGKYTTTEPAPPPHRIARAYDRADDHTQRVVEVTLSPYMEEDSIAYERFRISEQSAAAVADKPFRAAQIFAFE